MTFAKTKYHIVVMRERFVLIGILSQSDDAFFLLLDSAAVIRNWGTTRGLGQLARQGPQVNTKFDPEGDELRINKLEVSRIIPCTAEEWEEWTPK